MRLPGDRHVALAGNGDTTEARKEITDHPGRHEGDETRISQRHRERRRRDPIGMVIVASECAEWTATLKCKTHRCRHGTGDRRRGADQRHLLAMVNGEMDGRADGGSREKKDQKPQRTEPARDWRAKSKQPDSIET